LLTEDQVENLLKNGRLDKVEGLVTKTGSKLEKVNIILNDKKEVVLELENNDK
jgi:hypothetical protein